MVYKQISLELTPEQQKKASRGKSIQLTASQVASNKHKIFVHPANYEKLMKAKKKGCGCRMNIEHGEINHDLEHMMGGSIWDWIKKGFNWLKDSGVASTIADAAIPALATAVGAPQLGAVARSGLKSLSVGVGPKAMGHSSAIISGGRVAKGSQEAKDRMSKLRAMKKAKTVQGGSFLLN